MPVEPPPSRWVFPPLHDAPADGPVVLGGDLEPGTLLAAYRRGMFPMPLEPDGPIGWWSPDPRAILEPDALHVSRSLRRSCRRFRTTFDRAFGAVIEACADPDRPNGWIDAPFIDAYTRLHELGWAHSVEVWAGDTLAGGLYGVQIGGLFAGESMFHHRTDASKVALVALVSALRSQPGALLDVQWRTEHLASLGVTEIDRDHYLRRLADAVGFPAKTLSLPTEPPMEDR